MFKFWKELRSEVSNLKASLATHIAEDIHVKCEVCGIMGHKPDMQKICISPFGNFSHRYTDYYHNGCYAKKFNKHLCPNKCGKWVDNKKKGKK